MPSLEEHLLQGIPKPGESVASSLWLQQLIVVGSFYACQILSITPVRRPLRGDDQNHLSLTKVAGSRVILHQDSSKSPSRRILGDTDNFSFRHNGQLTPETQALSLDITTGHCPSTKFTMQLVLQDHKTFSRCTGSIVRWVDFLPGIHKPHHAMNST